MVPRKKIYGWLWAVVIVLLIVGVILAFGLRESPEREVEIGEGCAGPFRVGYSAGSYNYVSASGETRERLMAAWYPADGNGDALEDCGKFPLIVFSHGYGGCGTQSRFLTEGLARAGYVVATADHADARCSIAGGDDGLEEYDTPDFTEVETWDDSKYYDRKEDISALIDTVLDSDEFGVDPSMIGGAGHSLGGYTMLSMAGARDSWEDSRIDAVLVLAPYARPISLGETNGTISIPVMLQGGTLDVTVTPYMDEVYSALRGPRYFFVLKRAGHFAWTNFADDGENADTIVEYSVAFFDRHIKNEDVILLEERDERFDEFYFS